MDCIQYLSKLLANFVYLQYKFHHLHTDMKGPTFMPIHTLMDEVYQFFGDDHIDRIKERARILGGTTPASIFELSQMTDIQELKTCPPMLELLQIVSGDLRMMEEFLSQWIDLSGKINDLVTQNTLIDFNDAVGKFRWKIEMSMPNETLSPKQKK